MAFLKNKSYLLSTPVVFCIIGFLLLISVMLFHRQINTQEFFWPKLSFISYLPAEKGNPIPDNVVKEITQDGRNISPDVIALKNAQRSIKWWYQESHPNLFITQE